MSSQRPHLQLFLLLAVATALVCVGFPAAADSAATGSPEEVATRFLKAFEQKDIDTVVSLFAPGALVQRARLTEAAPELAHFGAQEWAEDAKSGIAGVQDFKIEVLEISSLSFDEGTTVSVRFRATGRVGENSFFINHGVDSFSLTRIEGEWRVLLYNSMEKLEFGG